MNTITELQKMGDDDLRVMLAELVGWERLVPPEPLLWRRDGVTTIVGHADWRGPDNRLKQTDDMPRYASDLNACHEVESKLPENVAADYDNHLKQIHFAGARTCEFAIIPSDFVWHATARERAIALILTLHKNHEHDHT